MELIRQEYRKMFLKKSLLVVLIVLSAINAIKIGTEYKYNAYYGGTSVRTQNEKAAYSRLYTEEYSGAITDEKISRLMDYINSHYSEAVQSTYDKTEDFDKYLSGTWFGDYHAYYFKLYLPYKYAYEYRGYADRIAAKVVENVSFYRQYGNAYEVDRNYRIAKQYSNRKITEFYDTEGAKVYLNYDFSSLLILIILVYALTPVFVGERLSGMQTIISVSRFGSGSVAAAKLISSEIYAVGVTAWFKLLDIVQHGILYSCDGLNLPIYAIEQFKATPLTLSIWQYILVDFGSKLLAVTFFTALILLISVVCDNWISAFSTEIGIIGALIVIYDFLPQFNCIDPVSLLTSREIFSGYNTINIFNNAVSEYAILIPAVIIFIAADLIFAIRVYLTKSGAGRSIKFMRRVKS